MSSSYCLVIPKVSTSNPRSTGQQQNSDEKLAAELRKKAEEYSNLEYLSAMSGMSENSSSGSDSDDQCATVPTSNGQVNIPSVPATMLPRPPIMPKPSTLMHSTMTARSNDQLKTSINPAQQPRNQMSVQQSSDSSSSDEDDSKEQQCQKYIPTKGPAVEARTSRENTNAVERVAPVVSIKKGRGRPRKIIGNQSPAKLATKKCVSKMAAAKRPIVPRQIAPSSARSPRGFCPIGGKSSAQKNQPVVVPQQRCASAPTISVVPNPSLNQAGSTLTSSSSEDGDGSEYSSEDEQKKSDHIVSTPGKQLKRKYTLETDNARQSTTNNSPKYTATKVPVNFTHSGTKDPAFQRSAPSCDIRHPTKKPPVTILATQPQPVIPTQQRVRSPYVTGSPTSQSSQRSSTSTSGTSTSTTSGEWSNSDSEKPVERNDKKSRHTREKKDKKKINTLTKIFKPKDGEVEKPDQVVVVTKVDEKPAIQGQLEKQQELLFQQQQQQQQMLFQQQQQQQKQQQMLYQQQEQQQEAQRILFEHQQQILYQQLPKFIPPNLDYPIYQDEYGHICPVYRTPPRSPRLMPARIGTPRIPSDLIVKSPLTPPHFQAGGRSYLPGSGSRSRARSSSLSPRLRSPLLNSSVSASSTVITFPTDSLFCKIDVARINSVPSEARVAGLLDRLSSNVQVTEFRPKTPGDSNSKGPQSINVDPVMPITKCNSRATPPELSKAAEKDIILQPPPADMANRHNQPQLISQPPSEEPIYRSAFEADDEDMPDEGDASNRNIRSLREAIKLKHAADTATNTFSQLALYLESAVYFLITASALESDKDSGKSANSMYKDSLALLNCILGRFQHLRLPSATGESDIYNKVAVLCLRCQSLILIKIYALNLKYNTEQNVQKLISNDDFMPYYLIGSDLPKLSPTHSQESDSKNSPRGQKMKQPENGPSPVDKAHRFYFYICSSYSIWQNADKLVREGKFTDFFIQLDRKQGSLSLNSNVFQLFRYVKLGLSDLGVEMSKLHADSK